MKFDKRVEGRDFDVSVQDRGSWLTVVAIHGGKIEKMTSEIASGIAGDEHNRFLFEGKIRNNNWAEFHIPSTDFYDLRLERMIRNSKTLISVHGYSDLTDAIILGGGNTAFKEIVKRHLSSLPILVSDGARKFEGSNERNIVNRCSDKGVQLEVSSGLRKKIKVQPLLLDKLCYTMRLAVEEYQGQR